MKAVEQVSEIKTSKLGAILLTLMVIFIFSISQNFLLDISGIVTKPPPPSHCILELATASKAQLQTDLCREVPLYSSYYYDESEFDFEFNQTDIKYSLDSKYNDTISNLATIFSINAALSSQNENLDEQRQDLQDQDPDLNPLQIKYQKLSINELIAQRDAEYKLIQSDLAQLKADFQGVNNQTNFQLFFYLLAEFFLQLIFVLPFFILGLRKYFQLKKNNSPYTVISTAVVVAASLLLLQVVLGFLFEALPWGYLEKVWLWFQNFQFLKYIVYYATVILTIAVFGGVVYYIQKNTYASDKVAKRRVLKGQCPNCETKIKDSYNNCRGCGLDLKIKCSACHKSTSKFFHFCSNCGSKLKHK